MADIAFIAYDIYDISQNGLSWESGLALGADVVGAVVPFASGGGVAVRALMHADDAVDAVHATGNIVDSTCALDNAENVAQLGGKVSPDFVVTPKGEAIPVPNGAVGPVSTKAPGFQYTGVSGGKGMDKKVTSVRIMEANKDQGPRVVYMNKSGQTVNSSSGKTVANSHPSAHNYLNPWE